jgi:hypothetical protein
MIFAEAVDVKGEEFDWTCCDVEGFCGYFSTAGVGIVPRPLLAKLDDFQNVADDILSLPARGDAVFDSKGTKPIFDWIEIAKRGFFAYDWSRADRVYRLLATPSVPLRVNDIPTDSLRTLTELVRMELAFSRVSSVETGPR